MVPVLVFVEPVLEEGFEVVERLQLAGLRRDEMLRQQVRAVRLGSSGDGLGRAGHEQREGALAVESSTVSPAWIDELRAAVPRLLDAPVAGSRPQAEAGQLIFLVGGDAADLDAARPDVSAASR